MTTPQTKDEPDNLWSEFRSWHMDSKLYREIYARTVSALIAAFVIWLVAVFSGSIDVTGETVVTVTLSTVAFLWLATWFPLLFKVAVVVGRGPGVKLARSTMSWIRAAIAVFGPFIALMAIGALLSK